MEIKRISVADLFCRPDFNSFVTDYAEDSGNADLGAGRPDFSRYVRMESEGHLAVSVALDGDKLVGLVAISFFKSLHYSCPVAMQEALFLTKDYRKGSAGMRLIREGKRLAKEFGAIGIVRSAPFGTRLARLYERMFGNATDMLFWEKL